MADERAKLSVVICSRHGDRITGFYEVEGRFRVLQSRLGTAQAVLGLQEPRKMAVKLLQKIFANAPEPGRESAFKGRTHSIADATSATSESIAATGAR